MRRHVPFTVTPYKESRARREGSAGSEGFSTAGSPNGLGLLEDAGRQDWPRTLTNTIEKM